MNESSRETEALAEKLRQLQPAGSGMDVRQTFYRAGYESCRMEMQSRRANRIAFNMVAAVIAFMVLVPTSYHMGKLAAVASDSQVVAQSDSNESLPRQSNDHATDDVQVPAVTSSASTDEEEQRKQSERVDLAAIPRSSYRYTSWMNPLMSVALSTQLDRQSDSMRMTSRSSLFAFESAIRSLSDFPFSVSPPAEVSLQTEDGTDVLSDEDPRPTLAVGDLHALSISLEANR